MIHFAFPVDMRQEPVGYDSTIMLMPDVCYTEDGALLVSAVRTLLRQVNDAVLVDMGERMHHAEWTVTDDPAQVTTLGLMHDCATCRAGVDQAVAYLRDHPGKEVAVGQMWWAA